MITRTIKDFDLGQIARSGQCFRMNAKNENTYYLIAMGKYLEIKQEDELFTFSCEEEEYENLWEKYFDLRLDYGAIKKSVDLKDDFMQKAISCGGGIRILKQELWEMIVTFIISQQNNIPRIKKCVEILSTRYGEAQINHLGETYYLFPEAEVLAGLQEEDLRACNLGYRGKYILRTAQEIRDGSFPLDILYNLPYEETKSQLLKLFGVGIKVAECICLFALHHIEAFPIDTHIKSVLDTYYPSGFPFERYKGYAGVLQQYAFYYKANGLIAADKNNQEVF
jgi:N-glycosylase/DNA lyase